MPAPTARPLPRLKRGQAAALLVEVERYLAAVETFRAEGRELQWLPEPCPRRRRRAAAAD